ncbi:MAG: hypothetical protein PHR68_01650 [Candidatus Gracilibacteria bacterium]|nr:hypothetical protein [Candidatus Gracilibacteria bacterium]
MTDLLKGKEKLEDLKKFYEGLGISDLVKEKIFDLIELDISENKDQIKFHRYIKEIISRKAENKIFRIDNDKTYINEFLQTFVAIGINNQRINYSNLSNLGNKEKSYKNYEENYKNWLGKKLLLGKEDRKEKSVEDIENIARLYITSAIEHIKEFTKIFKEDELNNLKSEFFETIHTTGSEQKTVYQYIEMLFSLEKSKKDLLKRSEYIKNPAKFETFIKNIEIGKFEIQRLLGIALLYLDREKNHVHQHIEEDVSFIIGKLLEIVPESEKNDFVKLNTSVDRPLYPYVNTYNKYWKKTNNGYIYKNSNKKGYKLLKMDGLLISGEYRDYNEKKVDVELKHISIRGKKSGFSSIEKLIRKGFSTFNEILDQKGFIFVVENFDEGKKLIKIIENKLGTLRSSWVEEPKNIGKCGGNNFTSSDYDCMKGIIKIPYKGKLIKHFFDILDSHMNLLDKGLKDSFMELKSTINGLNIENEENFEKLEYFFGKLNDKNILNIYHELKSKFKEKSYNIEVEIQIFDMENYMKAEIDKNSPAYHGKYKMRQLTENIPIYFPKELYGEKNIKHPISRIVKENL